MMTIGEVREKAIGMADTIHDMLDLIERGFMEHKTEYLAAAMDREGELNEMEKALTQEALVLARSSKDEKDRAILLGLAQVVETLERMGDEAANIVERVEIKIQERLLFSELGKAQFIETYEAMKKSVDMMRTYLRGRSEELKDRIIDNGFHVKALIERYRQEHMDRLLKGICTPMAANIFFDMLDFTGNLARHSSNIVKTI